jgi:sterol desaturase/sphingolipid hydroxylase (fatty acid hydroxylase superfamily)
MSELQHINLFTSTTIITGILFTSTLTSYGICKLYNYPFMNPQINKEVLHKRFTYMVRNIIIIMTEVVLLFTYLFHPNLDKNKHTLIQTTINLSLYVLYTEFIYYMYHRWIHKNFLYKYVHSEHHTIMKVYPFDTFYISLFDFQFLIVSLGLPMLILNLNLLEHNLGLYYYITISYLSHSKLFYDHHYIHHKYFIYNYCFSIPIFDILFGTYKEKMIEE